MSNKRRTIQPRSSAAGSSVAIVAVALATTTASAAPPHHPGGFWKCPPRGNVQGVFDNEDPVALAGHAHVPTDCALHWSDGHGATYCFATPPSLLLFEDDPEILPKAQAFWRTTHPTK